MTMNEPEKLSYGVDEAATALGIGRTSLYKLNKAGRLPFVKVQGRTLIRRNDLEDLLQPDRKQAA